MGDNIKHKAIGWPACILSLLWLMLFSQTDMAATVHGWLMPVTTPIQVTSVEPATINGIAGSRIKGFATIERASCDYIYVTWELAGGDKSAAVTAFFADKAQIRGEGRSTWEALMVGVTPDRLIETRGTVRHECGRFPVSTPFFVPDTSMVPTVAGATGRCVDGAYTTSTGPGTCSGHGGVEEWFNVDE